MGTNATRDTVVKTGDVVEGRYRIIKTLGEGGMGTVFLAEHTLIKRRVAIKILHPELATDAEVIERFMNEARAAGTLGHPNIVESTDMGFTTNHVPYIVFEYLEGTLLTDEVYRVGGLPVRRAVRIAQQIASALHAAHNAGIVHRDLKSDNVFLTDKDDALDHVKVLDFGISRFLETEDESTRRGMVMGTPEFMAPEQITAPDAVDKRADIYALGVILYEMLTARRPFSNDEDPRALMHRIVNNPPPPLQRPEVPHGMGEMILNKLLAKDPAQRFQSMLDVEAALDAFVTQDGVRGGRRTRASMQVAAVPDDVARYSDLIPRPAKAQSLDTPWPPEVVDKIQQVSLPQPVAKKPWALYGVAAFGLVAGGAGLMFGLRGGSNDKVALQPTPAITQPLPAAATTPAPREPVAPSKIQVELNANVQNARVTFRRRVAAAPASMQITPSDIVELVEVSAPGYKTVRYWLTFDRPTTLTARLSKGNGLVEASEEQTLVALGELAAPAQPAVAVAAAAPAATPAAATVAVKATPAPAVAKTVERTEKVAAAPAAPKTTTETPPAAVPTPRKIGRGTTAAEEIASTDATTTSVEPPKVEPVKVDPKAEPVAKAEPKTEPKAAPEIAKPAIDYATINSVVSKNRVEILKCYAQGAKKTPGLKGTLSLQLQVDPSGKVRAQVQSTLGAPLVAACVIKAASSWKFPARPGSDIANVTYPFKFGS
jgi:serine/threonine-protein kinase